MAMTSSKPYLLRGLYDWIVDNDKTPYIVIDATAEGVNVPEEYIEDGQIVLNISPAACRGLHIDDEKVLFTVRFAGIATQVYSPPRAVLAIYAQENGQGMVFSADEPTGDDDGGGQTGSVVVDTEAETQAPAKRSTSKKPTLKIVK